ncbi:hypothetical protein RPMD05_11 [Rhodobacteraceae phage LS06-2018-MD05]|nr:hypothetical protein RPMD05_11 [Rhodobacteraceae phage LS06-2018-MD05]
MEIIKLLEAQIENTNPDRFRYFKSIKAGKYTLSIQGSTGHYCTPRESLKASKYSSMEIAIMNKNSMVSINLSSVFRKFSRYSELLECADSLGSKAAVYGYVPVDLINDLYLFLTND